MSTFIRFDDGTCIDKQYIQHIEFFSNMDKLSRKCAGRGGILVKINGNDGHGYYKRYACEGTIGYNSIKRYLTY